MPEFVTPDLELWKKYVDSLDCRPLFVTVSGAHLYGFPSPDSDIDLRGCHMLPLGDVVGLSMPKETFEVEGIHQNVEVDLVSHDIGKYLRLMVKNNGYILEQIFSPLIVFGESFLEELRPIASNCVTRHHYHHYRGFYGNQRKMLEKEEKKRAKPLLYAYRVLLTGIHLLQTGVVEANLLHLNEDFKLPYIDELIASKTSENASPAELDWSLHAARLDELEGKLDQAFADSTLPEDRDQTPVNEFLVHCRLHGHVGSRI